MQFSSIMHAQHFPRFSWRLVDGVCPVVHWMSSVSLSFPLEYRDFNPVFPRITTLSRSGLARFASGEIEDTLTRPCCTWESTWDHGNRHGPGLHMGTSRQCMSCPWASTLPLPLLLLLPLALAWTLTLPWTLLVPSMIPAFGHRNQHNG